MERAFVILALFVWLVQAKSYISHFHTLILTLSSGLMAIILPSISTKLPHISILNNESALRTLFLPVPVIIKKLSLVSSIIFPSIILSCTLTLLPKNSPRNISIFFCNILSHFDRLLRKSHLHQKVLNSVFM